MNQETTPNSYREVCRLIHSRKVTDAIMSLRKLIAETNREFLNQRLDMLEDTYRNILRYSFAETRDPERENVYHYLLRSLLGLADEIHEHLLCRQSGMLICQIKNKLSLSGKIEREEAMGLLEALTFDHELSNMLKGVGVGNSAAGTTREEALIRIFNIVWLTDSYTEAEIALLQTACHAEKLPWHDKALIVSALTLSLLRFFDINKFTVLFTIVQKREEFVWERAMIGIFMGFLKYNDRFYLYPALREKTLSLRAFPDIEKNIEAILIQYTKSRETDKVRKKWEEEVLPEMMKMRPKLEEKLDLNSIFQDDASEDKNPDWETVFEEAPDLLNKLQEFTEMQLEGMDVFISAFSQLKGFPFFRDVSNWFVPFYAENEAIAHIARGSGESIDLTPLLERLEATYFMCNSDKYSFCLNLGLVPEQQKAMMMNILNAEMKNISELEKDEALTNSFARTKSMYTQYFQDLYRFFKLHPWRREFDDIFDMDTQLYDTAFINLLMSDKKMIRNIAELYFDKKFYQDALKLFLTVLEHDSSNIELFEKIAYCYEYSGEFARALDYYKKADIIEEDRLWIIKKMAYCSKTLNLWQEAHAYYVQAEKLDPDDLKVKAHIGQCLIHLERYEEALQYYFMLEVLSPENHKIRRPLAWCSFLLGKLDTASDYLERILAEDPGNKYDLMNLGHVCWCKNETGKAFEIYKKSLASWKTFQQFEASFNEDKRHLHVHGIEHFDIDLMLDYLKMHSQEAH